jgi:hypothetical protein
VSPGSPAEGGKIDGNSIKYEKMDNKILSATCFVKSMFFLCVCVMYDKKNKACSRLLVINISGRRENHWLAPYDLARAEGFPGWPTWQKVEKGTGMR